MPKRAKKKIIGQYQHPDKERANNPPVGLVDPKTDPDKGEKQTWAYDPHLDPQLQWAGKAEHTTFDVPTVSLHVHERIDPRTILEAVRNRNGDNGRQASLFEQQRDLPLRHEIEFYQHAHNWSNRLIAGDSLLVMNSLLQKENMAGKVQCVYMDPPYGIKYGSNFQPFVGKRDVKDRKDEDLTTEPEMIKAFRDTWELGIHSYLSYMRDRLLLARELLTDSGSVFVQISDENVHHVREIMDEVFGVENFVSLISYRTTAPLVSKYLTTNYDYLVWYSKNKKQLKFRLVHERKPVGKGTNYVWIEKKDGTRRRMSAEELGDINSVEGEIFYPSDFASTGYTPSCTYDFEFEGRTVKAGKKSWRTHQKGLDRLIDKNRIMLLGKNDRPCFIQYHADYPLQQISNVWTDTRSAMSKKYVVETSEATIARSILMTTDPGDLVFDPTCGSGTTAYVAEQWGRRWITCDTSRVATTLAKQRLMTATFDYYKLAWPNEGVGGGFEYKKVPHITLKSIANDEPPATETLYDQPIKDSKRARITGPFTVEAVPSPAVQPITEFTAPDPMPADQTVARTGETLRQDEWRNELLKTGIRGKGGQRIAFSRVQSLPCRWLHADAETKPDEPGDKNMQDTPAPYTPRRAVVSFGPEHAPLEQRQVKLAVEEAQTLVPEPKVVVFAAFQFDPEAAKDIDETNWPGVTLLKAQMNADMQTGDLKKKRAGNESFWLIGQPDVTVEKIPDGEHAGKHRVQVNGFDYFNTKTGELQSGGKDKIAVWLLDTDYDGRSLYPSQVFFPLSDAKTGWSKLARNLRAEIDQDLIESYKGTISLPFKPGENARIAVKIVDNRGIESLKVVNVAENEG